MQPHPDSALALLRSIDTTALCTPAIKAREAHNYVLRTHDTILTNASLFSIVRREHFYLNQENFKELNDLCNTYYKTEGRSSQAHSVCGEVRSLLKNLGVGVERYNALEQRVNEHPPLQYENLGSTQSSEILFTKS